jgi:hypothetical protein
MGAKRHDIDLSHSGRKIAVKRGQGKRAGLLLSCAAKVSFWFIYFPPVSSSVSIEIRARCQSNVAHCQDKHRLRDYLFPRIDFWFSRGDAKMKFILVLWGLAIILLGLILFAFAGQSLIGMTACE